LEDYGLIGWDREANRYDAHPIVRSVAWGMATNWEKDSIYTSFLDYLDLAMKPPRQEIETLEDLALDMEKYNVLTGLERFDEAYEFFLNHLEKITLCISANRERINCLLRLFPNDSKEPPALSREKHKCLTYNSLGISYKNSGQPGSSLDFYRKSELLSRLHEDYENRQAYLSNLSIALCEAGFFYEAFITLHNTLDINRKTKNRV